MNPEAVGHTASVINEVTPRWALAYSAALGLTAPIYLDDERSTELIVPPTFCVCLEWTLAGLGNRSKILGLTDDERRKIVHVLQDSRFHRPLKIGMRVETTSRVAFMRCTSAGTYVLNRFTHKDASSGETLITSFSGGMVRDVMMGLEMAGQLPSELAESVETDAMTEHLDPILLERGLPHIYSECARIWNPIHTERAVALKAGLHDIIVHGTISWAVAAREIIARNQKTFADLSRLSAEFRAPVAAGQSIRIVHSKVNGGKSDFAAINESGDSALRAGKISFTVPKSHDDARGA